MSSHEDTYDLEELLKKLEVRIDIAIDNIVRLRSQRDQARRAMGGLVAALRPLAQQDCESWGCDIHHIDGPCAPEAARTAISRTAWLAAQEMGLAR